MSILRGVVAGLGIMGNNHLRVLQNAPGLEVIAAVDPSDVRRDDVLRRYPGLDAHTDLAAALESAQPDFACLAAPVTELPALARLCIDARVPLLVEKPMAPTAQEARAIADEAAAAGVPLAVGYVERFNPAIKALRGMLDSGMAGELHQLHARRLSPQPNRTSMLGVTLDLATHDIDVMRYLAGSEVLRVFAETSRRRHEEREDLLCAILRYEGQATGLLEVNWLTPAKLRRLTVTGEKGMFVVDYLMQDLEFHAAPGAETEWDVLAGMRGSGEGDMVRYALQRREPLALEWQDFEAALRTGRDPAVGAQDAIAVLDVVEAIGRSATTHAPQSAVAAG